MYRAKRKKKVCRKVSPNDTHHIMFTRRRWDTGAAKALREHYYAKALIPKDTLHKAIHAELAYVPVPRKVSIMFALNQLQLLEDYHAISADDSFEKKLKVLIALFECLDEPTAEALRQQLEIVQQYYGEPP